jgi:hypothetical protein
VVYFLLAIRSALSGLPEQFWRCHLAFRFVQPGDICSSSAATRARARTTTFIPRSSTAPCTWSCPWGLAQQTPQCWCASLKNLPLLSLHHRRTYPSPFNLTPLASCSAIADRTSHMTSSASFSACRHFSSR